MKIELESDAYRFPSRTDQWSWTDDDTALTLKNMENLLRERNVAPHLFALMLPDIDQRWCLHKDGIFWVVYFSERGQRFSVGIFGSVDNACKYLVAQLIGTE